MFRRGRDPGCPIYRIAIVSHLAFRGCPEGKAIKKRTPEGGALFYARFLLIGSQRRSHTGARKKLLVGAGDQNGGVVVLHVQNDQFTVINWNNDILR